MSKILKANERVAKNNHGDQKCLPSLSIMVACAGILFLLGICLFSGIGERRNALASQKEITYPVERFQDGKARHFKYEAGNDVVIKYFIVKSSDGVLRAAFDACDVCWPAGKGYYQKGDFMVCRNCGSSFEGVSTPISVGGGLRIKTRTPEPDASEPAGLDSWRFHRFIQGSRTKRRELRVTHHVCSWVLFGILAVGLALCRYRDTDCYCNV